MLMRIRDDERGVAMVVAIMVTLVVFLLGAVVMEQAIHNSTASGYDRKRVQSVDAAEAGLNYFYDALQHTQAGGLTGIPTTGSVAASPGSATYTVTPTWYSDSAGTVIATPPFSDSSFPHSVKLVSVGTTNGTTTRKMETFLQLTPTFGGFDGAVVTENCVNLVNSFVISGNSIYDGSVIVTGNCNVSMTSGNQIIKGNVYVANGYASISTQVHIYGDVWANGAVTINHSQAVIDHNAISSTSSLSVPAGTVTGSGTYCTTVSGTTNIKGGTVRQCQGPPPTPQFPREAYNDTSPPASGPPPTYASATDSAWYGSDVPDDGCHATPVANCWEEVVFGSVGSSNSQACTDARNYIEGTGPGTYNGGTYAGTANGVPIGPPNVPGTYSGVVVRILSSCTYSSSNNVTVNLNSDLALITNGSINLTQRSTWTGVGASRKLYFIVPWLPNKDASSPTNPCPTGDVTVGNNTNFNSLITTGLYTPCTAHMSNQNAFYGQVVGRTVDIGNNWNMNFRPIIFPGAHVSGFKQDVAYIREIA